MARELKSSSMNVRPDQMNTLTRNGIQVNEGEVIFNTDTGQNEYWNGSSWIGEGINESIELDNRIIVTQANKDATIGGVIDSSKQYFLDGIIDLGTTQITVPITGITLVGLSFDISGLISSADNYTMFVSESIAIGSGNVLGADYLVSVTGASSKVYELYDATGFNAFEFTRINYIDCTSLGDIYDYRQGLESGTGRFGGSPSLTLHGLWRGGYRITTSIVRSLAGTMTAPLFKAGTLFQMNSRFLSDINCDLPTLASFFDFAPVNFPNPSTIQLKGVEMTRDGGYDSDDINLTPNISASNLASEWRSNNGLTNTYVGGTSDLSVELLTTITLTDTAYNLNGTFVNTDLQHFDSPSNGQLRHLGNTPRDYGVLFNFILEGAANEGYSISLIKDSGGVETVVNSQLRQITNQAGGRDVAYFNSKFRVTLNQNDFVYWKVTNVTGTGNCTLETDSDWSVEER